MNIERGPWRKLNNILTAVSAIILLVWILKWFGGGEAVRQMSEKYIRQTAGWFFWLGVMVICCGYLLWRLFDWFFWRKYFK